MQTLIETPLALSPHAAWQRQHDLTLREYQHVHSLNRSGDRWVCCNTAQTRYASGDTEDAAEMAYCARYSIDWWKLAEWNAAMEVRRVDAGSPVSGDALAFAIPPEAGWSADEEMSLG